MKKYISPWIAATSLTKTNIPYISEWKLLFVRYTLGEKYPCATIYHIGNTYQWTVWFDKHSRSYSAGDRTAEAVKYAADDYINMSFITLPLDRFEKLTALV